MNFLARRRLRKMARELLRHARHLRNMREDVMDEPDLRRLDDATGALRSAIESRDQPATDRNAAALRAVLHEATPVRSWPGVRENLEILVVAVAVAMAFRTYFIQPFKIPTGSMQPSLYGIHTASQNGPGFLDRVPMRYVKWLLTGQSYREVRARNSGQLSGPFVAGQDDPSNYYYEVGPRRYKVPKSAQLLVPPGSDVRKGDLLWAGIVTAGDHVFVDKVRWNFRRPRRGDVIVFSTLGISDLPPGTHYIKRLVGLPRERISIEPPNLKADGVQVTEPESIARIARQESGYAGYQLARLYEPALLHAPTDEVHLGPEEYFALGDNTMNSRDGRYWGAIPRANAVGPAVLVYWPFSIRWGRIR